MNQVIEALNVLYNSSDLEGKQRADESLKIWQQTSDAWSISDQILAAPGGQQEIYYFAAQTLRTKIQFDFFELPANTYVQLRDSLLTHIVRYRAAENAPILTQLCLAAADLAIQMDVHWPNVAASLLERFCKEPENFAALLEILQYLPEECMNEKLMCDRQKRVNSARNFRSNRGEVINFILQINCPNLTAKKKVFDCFLAWLKFVDFMANELADCHLLRDAFHNLNDPVVGEVSADIIIKVIKMTSQDLPYYHDVISVIMPAIVALKSQFAGASEDLVTSLCRIYTESGESYMQTIINEYNDQGVQGILEILCHCTNIADQEISSIPLDFWYKLSHDIQHHPEQDVKVDQFKPIFTKLLHIAIERVTLPTDVDPFEMDDDFLAYRARMNSLAEDCLMVLTANAGLEVVLKSLQDNHSKGIVSQEAHFYLLTRLGSRAETVCENSVLWDLIKSLPNLINQNVGGTSLAELQLLYCKRTAIELLGNLTDWIRMTPDIMRTVLEMLSQLLLEGVPAEAVQKQHLKNTAAVSFRSLCLGSTKVLQEMVPNLCELYTRTLPAMPCKYHLYVIEGITNVTQNSKDENVFNQALDHMCTPLINELQQRHQGSVVCDIFDRLVCIIRNIRVRRHDPRADTIGRLVVNGFWPVIQKTLEEHQADGRVVEKCCRLLKHSMRCVAEHFKPLVEPLATCLVTRFQNHQHSSYLYSAEILANTYSTNDDCLPVLNALFQRLSETALRVLSSADSLEGHHELVEDFYGMFERYFRYVPMVVLNAPTLSQALQLCTVAVFVMHKDASEALFAFLESIFWSASNVDPEESTQSTENQQRIILRPLIMAVAPQMLKAVLQVIVGVPPTYVRESVIKFLDVPKNIFPQEWPAWITQAVQVVPQAAIPDQEKQAKLLPTLINSPPNAGFDVLTEMQGVLYDLAYRCEQVALRNRNQKPQEVKVG